MKLLRNVTLLEPRWNACGPHLRHMRTTNESDRGRSGVNFNSMRERRAFFRELGTGMTVEEYVYANFNKEELSETG
jgi:hypothetical protein